MPEEETATPKVQSGDLRFEDIVHNGRHVTIVRDAAGSVVYPSYVPPETRSPNDATSPRSTISEPRPAPPPAGKLRPEKSKTYPPTKQAGTKVSTGKPKPRDGSSKEVRTDTSRPKVDKRWATEGLRRGGRRSSILPPAPRRAGTSYLNKALQQSYDDESTSSSSSSDEEEDEGREDSGNDPPGVGSGHGKSIRRASEEEHYGRFRVANPNFKTKGKIKRDGRLRITVKETAGTGYLAKALGAAAQKVTVHRDGDEEAGGTGRPARSRISSGAAVEIDQGPRPRLNIVIMVIGSRGDAQPFLKIGKVLKEEHGHRVRIATHPAFKEFVEKDSGLEFFSVGGDPSELMAFMVKNPGMIPKIETVKAGDIGRRRAAMAEMFDGFWRACIDATDDARDMQNLRMMGDKPPFVADAIIANPPSFAHVHCAEALGIPLHLMFTFPYTPTQAFPHPLASIKKSNVDPGYTNFISYPLVEMMVWQGLGDLVNDFRVNTLRLDPVSTLWAPGSTYRLHVPYTYLWSPSLVQKPEDWGDEIDISGFVFLDLASSFKPPRDLEVFLGSGEMPVYIGFGSIVVDDANRFTEMIFDAVKLAGVRAVVSKGWGGLGGDNVPGNIYMLENTPHDWLFPKVKACVIHGGAGTTAIALKCGKPTMVVPFFGDQHFWGSMIGNAGAGPDPVPYKHLTAEKLAEGIKYCLTDKAQHKAQKLAESIELEGDGAENAVDSFHEHLRFYGKRSMRCSVLPDRVAVWKPKKLNIKLSAMAADILVGKGELSWKKMRLLRHVEWNDFEGPGEPVTGAAGSIVGSVGAVFGGVGGVPYRLRKTSQKIRERKERKKRHRHRQQMRRRNTRSEPTPAVAAPTQMQEGQHAARDYAQPNKAAQPSRPARQDTLDTASLCTNTTADHPTEAYVSDFTEGVGKSASALAKAPVDLSLAVAQGFHNAPRLYGDDTVRRPPRVTGFQSGLRAARFEFAYGIYDGWTGVVKHPIRGAKREGVNGFLKGTGIGLLGLVLKGFSAAAGPVAYTMKGIAKEVERSKQPMSVVRRARIAQGQREASQLDDEERRDLEQTVIHAWEVVNEFQATVNAHQERKGIAGILSSKRVKKELGSVLERVDNAEEALAAIKKGESVDSVIDAERRRRKGEEKRIRSEERRRSQEKRRSMESKRRSLELTNGTHDSHLKPARDRGSRPKQQIVEEEEESPSPDGEHELQVDHKRVIAGTA